MPRYKHTAVARNQLKRRLRELARLRLLPALADLPPADVVVRVWPSAYGAGFDALAADVVRALGQLRRGMPAPPAPAPTEPIEPIEPIERTEQAGPTEGA